KGDANYNPSAGVCEPLQPIKLDSSVTTDVHDSSHDVITTAPIGSSVHDKATVSGSGPAPTGSVTFKLYSTTDCTGSFTTETVTLSSGMAESSATTVPNTGLSYMVIYKGDANYNPSAGVCEPLQPIKLDSSVTTDVHDSSHDVITTAPIGSSVHDKATVSGSGPAPTGTVTFKLYSTTDCTGSFTTQIVTLGSSGMAESSTTTVPNTGLSYQVTYSGDANYNPATSTCEPLPAIKLDPTVTTEIHNASHAVITSALIGTSVHDKATVSGSGPAPTSTVTFKLYSTTDCTGSFTTETVTLSSGMAESSATTVPNTGLSYMATYNGDANYNPATSACEPLPAVKLPSTVVTTIHDSSHNPITAATVGTSVHDKATVSGSGPVPTGTVTFSLFNNTTCTGSPVSTQTVTLSGGMAESNPTVTALPGLCYQVTYSGDANYSPSTSAIEPLVVNCATPADIHGVKYLDYDGDGNKDPNDPYLPGITTTLTNTATGTTITTVTNAQGQFSFMNLPPGTYLVCEVLPPGLDQSFPRSGAMCPGMTFGYLVVIQGCESKFVKFADTPDTLDESESATLAVSAFQALSTKDGIQFLAAGHGIKDMQVQLYDLRGKPVYISGWQPNGWAWKLQNLKNQRVARGVYLYVVTVRGQNGEVMKTKLQKLVVR
ncbi:Ig-like domain repeat protein, partial [Candidatus Acetothermia bacterium]|nr:Ig-like domain repeat protein [Candidatus Acetothermia bacterium]